jgi:hypothetical protein
MSFLKENPDWVITFGGEGYHLGVHSSDETSGSYPLEFNGLHRVEGDPGYMVYPSPELRTCNPGDIELALN